MNPRRSPFFVVVSFAVVACAFVSTAVGFAFQRTPFYGDKRSTKGVVCPSGRQQELHQRQGSAALNMYVPSLQPMSQTSIMAATRMYPSTEESSLVNQSDALPSFRVANGLLSPQTVKRLDEKARNSAEINDAISYFLDTYKEYGPMACLPMLSDPQVLPELTRAMRESSL